MGHELFIIIGKRLHAVLLVDYDLYEIDETWDLKSVPCRQGNN